MAGHTFTTETKLLKQQVYHDFRTIITITIDEAGKETISTSTYQLMNGNSIKKSVLFGDKEGSIVDFSSNTSELEGSGGKQNGGIVFTTKTGGASPTKFVSISEAPHQDITYLVENLNRMGKVLGAKLPNVYAERLRKIFNKLKKVYDTYESNFDKEAIKERENDTIKLVLYTQSGDGYTSSTTSETISF